MGIRIAEEKERKTLQAEHDKNGTKFEWKGYSNPLTDKSMAIYADAMERGLIQQMRSQDGFAIQQQNTLNQLATRCASRCSDLFSDSNGGLPKSSSRKAWSWMRSW